MNRLFWLSVAVSICFGATSNAQPQVPPTSSKTPDAKSTLAPLEPKFVLGSTLFREPSYINAASLTPDGKEVAVCSNSTLVRFLDVATGKETRTITLKEYLRNNQIFFANNGKEIVTAGYNGIHISDATNGQIIRTIPPMDKDRRDGVCSISPNAKYISVGTMYENAQMRAYNLADGTELGTIKPEHNSSQAHAVSPNGDLLATWGQHYSRNGNPTPAELALPKTLHLWNLKTGKITQAIVTDANNVTAARFSNDGTQIATVGMGIVQLWETKTGKQIRQFAARSNYSQQPSIMFSPDGKQLAVSAGMNCVQVWDLTTGKRLGQCEGASRQQISMQYRPDGQLIAWGVNGNSLVLWEAPSGKPITPLSGHFSQVNSLQFSVDGKSLLSSTTDGQMIRWNMATGKEMEPIDIRPASTAAIRTYGNPRNAIAPVVYSPNHKYFVGTSTEGSSIGVWDAVKQEELFALSNGQGFIDRNGIIAFSGDSKRLVAMQRYNGRDVPMNIPVWDVESGTLLPSLKGQKGDFTAAAISTDGNTLTTCSYAYQPQGGQMAEAWSWEVSTGKVRSKITLPNVTFTAIGFLDHRLMLLFTPNSTIQKIYDSYTGLEVRPLENGGPHQASCMAISPDRRLIGECILAGDMYGPNGRPVQINRTISIWEAASGAIRQQFKLTGRNVQTIAFSPDGKYIAVALSDTTINVYEIAPVPPVTGKVDEDAVNKLWDTLNDSNGINAFNAMSQLQLAPELTIKLFKANLKPSDNVQTDDEKIKKLISNLDSPRYVVRETAMKDLERLGRTALPEVNRMRAKKDISAELQERLDQLILKLNKPDTTNVHLRPLRAIEILERLNTPEAKQILETLTKGGESPTTRAAQEAVERLSGR